MVNCSPADASRAGQWSCRAVVRCPCAAFESVVERMFVAAASIDPPRALALDRNPPEWLKAATNFKTDADTFNGLWVLKTLRRYEKSPHNLLAPLYEPVAAAA